MGKCLEGLATVALVFVVGVIVVDEIVVVINTVLAVFVAMADGFAEIVSSVVTIFVVGLIEMADVLLAVVAAFVTIVCGVIVADIVTVDAGSVCIVVDVVALVVVVVSTVKRNTSKVQYFICFGSPFDIQHEQTIIFMG